MFGRTLSHYKVLEDLSRGGLGILLIALLGFPACTQNVQAPANQVNLGLSSERLQRIGNTIEKSIADERIAGAVALVARHGQVAYLKGFGMMDKEAQKPMETDTIFRICSMTKPITSVAVMMLYEEGHFLLSEPISNFIPEFRDMQVLDPQFPGDATSPPGNLVAAKRPITIRHLLTHTAGLTYHWNPRLGKTYLEGRVGHGLTVENGAIGEAVKRLAGMPLLFHPGDAYEYSLADDVLGYLVEVVSGTSLDQFFKERIFNPLGMRDTYFFLPDEKTSRLAAAYTYYEEKGLQRFPDEPIVEETLVYSADYPYSGPKTYFSGGGGLSSTAEDYFRFCQMLLNGGELGGLRMLSRKSVELLSKDHVGRLLPGDGYGLGFGVNTSINDASAELASMGAYYWGGFFYTSFIIDPKEELIAIFMGQLHPDGGLTLSEKVLGLAFQAIID